MIRNIVILLFVFICFSQSKTDAFSYKSIYKKYLKINAKPINSEQINVASKELEEILFKNINISSADYLNLFVLYFSTLSHYRVKNWKERIIISFEKYFEGHFSVKRVSSSYEYTCLFGMYLLVLKQTNQTKYKNYFSIVSANLKYDYFLQVYFSLIIEKLAEFSRGSKDKELIDLSLHMLKKTINRFPRSRYYKSRFIKLLGAAFENLGNFKFASLAYNHALVYRLISLKNTNNAEYDRGNIMLGNINLAELNFKAFKFSESLEYLDIAYFYAKKIIKNHSKLAVIHTDYGKVYLETGTLDSAKLHLDKAQALRDSLYQYPHLYLAEKCLPLGRIL